MPGELYGSRYAGVRGSIAADTGAIFPAEGDELVFAYTHNDSLSPVDNAYKYAYAAVRMPVSKHSVAGCAAVTGQSLNPVEVRSLPYEKLAAPLR